MKFLLDTQLLLWAAGQPAKLPRSARKLIDDSGNELLDNGYIELPITSQHAASIDSLPPLHKDPFDRMLVAQAVSEGITLLTRDTLPAKYPAPVRKV